MKPIKISGELKKSYNEQDLFNWIIKKIKRFFDKK